MIILVHKKAQGNIKQYYRCESFVIGATLKTFAFLALLRSSFSFEGNNTNVAETFCCVIWFGLGRRPCDPDTGISGLISLTIIIRN
jgi:hypothetical protein